MIQKFLMKEHLSHNKKITSDIIFRSVINLPLACDLFHMAYLIKQACMLNVGFFSNMK